MGKLIWLTQIDPRVRILLACLFGVMVASLHNLLALVAAFGAALLLTVAVLLPSSQSVSATFKKMLVMDGFVIAMLLLLPFSVEGDQWFAIAGFSASWQGLWRAVEIALKANAIILVVLVLVGSMESVVLGQALGLMRVPMILVHLLLFTVRYIQVLKDEYQRLRQAMKARAFQPRNTWHTYRAIGYMFGMIIVRAVERSERVLEAMKCRGFAGQYPMLVAWRLSSKDAVFSLAFVAVMAFLLWVEINDILV